MFAWQATVQDDKGNAVPSPVVVVYESDGVTLAALFDESGSPVGNPLVGTPEGFVQFWAAAGQYKIEGASGSDRTETWDVVIGVVGASLIPTDTPGVTVQEVLNQRVPSASVFYASPRQYRIGTRVSSDDGFSWDISASGTGEFNHPASGQGITVVPIANTIFLEAYPIDLRRGLNTSSAAFVPPANMISCDQYVVKARDKCLANQYTLSLPGGCFKITEAGSFLPISKTSRTDGYVITGSSSRQTIVFFAPVTGGDANSLVWNNNSVIGLQFRNIRFHTLTAGAVLWNSYGSGVSQHQSWDQCAFTGTWTDTCVLSVNPDGGSPGNNNSEYRFTGCFWGIYSNNYNVIRGQSSDQNLNYWLTNCAIWGDVCIAHMEKGGHVYVTDCDVSTYAQIVWYCLRGRISVTNPTEK